MIGWWTPLADAALVLVVTGLALLPSYLRHRKERSHTIVDGGGLEALRRIAESSEVRNAMRHGVKVPEEGTP